MSKKPSQSLCAKLKSFTAPFRFDGSVTFHLKSHKTNEKGGLDKETAEKIVEANRKRLTDFQERLYAEDRRSEEHTSELQSLRQLVCRLLLEKKKGNNILSSHYLFEMPLAETTCLGQ